MIGTSADTLQANKLFDAYFSGIALAHALPIMGLRPARLWCSTDNREAPKPSADGVETLTVKVAGDHIFLRKAGHGPPVLLLHGGASDSS